MSKAFTLVELLIVIAILGIIAIIVIAAINPAEQANRARDTGTKADSGQLLSAIQRYYANNNKYPWNDCTGASCVPVVAEVSDAVTFLNANTAGYGLCGTGAGCPQGLLMSGYELQPAFLGKAWVTTTSQAEKIFIGKPQGVSSSVYVCWVPKSSSYRQTLINSGKISDPFTGFTPTGTVTVKTGVTLVTDPCWAPAAGALPQCAECLPQ